MRQNQNKTISALSLVEEIVKDYPVVIYNQLKVSLKNISNTIFLFSLPFMIVMITGFVIFITSILLIPICVTIILKPEYFKSKLKSELKESCGKRFR